MDLLFQKQEEYLEWVQLIMGQEDRNKPLEDSQEKIGH